MNSFWDSSWEQINSARINEYISGFDLESDAITEYLHSHSVKTVCDAGCGCGIYALKLASNGFEVSGFDVSAHAVQIAQTLLDNASVRANLKTASILSTGYADKYFDAVISRDVIDHMRKEDGIAAVQELYRVTRPGGIIMITLDHSDCEYETEPHTVNADGDYLFTCGKWDGMVFHPYTEQEIGELIPFGAVCHIQDGKEFLVTLTKPLGR